MARRQQLFRIKRAGAGETAMLRAITLAFALSVLPATAFAHSCPSIMAAIDAALPASTLAEADMTKVKELRAKGEQLHASGDHAGSETALNEAKKLLGI
ncbi:hypothetical protein FHS67_004264 [Aminobacter aminovorans]|jgi:hypothetical protein|uniref:Uncharacterized protein n=2 Tax=Aminobacter aminovorans TaxID=83263 RepID=A0ABR6HBW0_AMIAI|nr:hypothetical protein [Aminobacter aminovorans]